jgi:iron-sulfur cluster assembly protein
MSNVIITERAAQEVVRISAEQRDSDPKVPEQLYLRLRIVGGGCSGYSSKLDLDPEINEANDVIFEQHGVKVVVDKRSLLYVDGATIDYHEDLNQRGFKVDVPGAKNRCGCGSSYSF